MYAIIAGGGKVGFFLARELIDQGHEVLIIENNAERAEFIANELGNVVLRGNADEASTLAEAGAERADVVIAVTGDDPRNLVLLQVAKRRFGARRTVARINDPRNEGLFRMLGIDATVNATQVMLSVLEQEIPQANLVPLLQAAQYGRRGCRGGGRPAQPVTVVAAGGGSAAREHHRGGYPRRLCVFPEWRDGAAAGGRGRRPDARHPRARAQACSFGERH